jgi:hypothetical protein
MGNARVDFITYIEWPLNSPDLNPLNYHVRNELQLLVYKNNSNK